MTPITRHSFLTVGCAILIAAFLSGPPPASAQQAPLLREATHERGQHQTAGMASWEGSAEGKAYSEFNHHLAGVFVLLIGFSEVRSALALSLLAWSRFLLPAAMLAAGGYLLIWSDHEAWPVGTMSLVQTLTSDDLEILQHKAYAALLLAVGSIELLRYLGRVQHSLWRAPLPVFAIIGGLMLFLHSHGIHPSAHKIAFHHAIMGTMAISAGACKLVPGGWTTGETGADSAPGATARSLWDLAWAGLICLLGIQLLVYSE